MLTVKAPIEIKARTTYTADHDAFYARITGNYSLMETHLDSEDLLHLSVTPPEIYIQEGGAMTSILNSSQTNENNIQKVEILNNVLNRIVMSADAHISYQDRVFITDALYKLGIRNESRFMKAFYRMAEETRNTNTLINLYLERGGELREMVENLETEIRTERTEGAEETLTQRDNYLYESITDRLMTGAVYQIVSNFNRSVEENEIDRREYSISNQSYVAQHMLLSVLRNRTGITNESLIYLTDNEYEENLEQYDTGITNVRNEVNGAILMDMLKNIYHTGYDRFFLNDNRYYRFEDVFFGSSENTFNRLMQYQGDTSLTMRVSESLVDDSTTLMNSEIELLERAESGSGMSEEEIIDITRRVDEINLRNEERRQQYVELIRQVKERARGTESADSMSRTRKDAALALTSPEALFEKLSEEEEQRATREKEILKEVTSLLPKDAANVFEILNSYQENPELFIENNIIRPGAEGELIYDIREAERAAAEETAQRAERAAEDIRKIRESGEAARRSEEIRRPAEAPGYEAVPTIHRSTETITEEELEEQLNVLMQDVSRQIKQQTESETVTEYNTSTTRQVINNRTVDQTINERQIRQMIDAGVKAQMSAISNQVSRRMETQFRNEKIRRGY
ncbi:MAG: hypothetical protein K6F54_00735 [Lachnospiraceae bacterium]|nr:hypothetical protein [Lachnospiraceae bacterium]